MTRILFDTDVIIDYLRGDKQAIHYFESCDVDFYISVITIAELYSGVKGDQEREELDYFLLIFTVFPVTTEIAVEGGILRQRWHDSHGMGLADALIASTANVHEMNLVSLNEKYFGMLDFLIVPYRKV